MKERIDLTKYRLGAADAWDQIERDDLLTRNECFLPISQFSEILQQNKSFLCGRRGSGKSVIAIKMAEQPLWEYVEAVQGEDEQYGAYLNIVRQISEYRDQGINVDIKESVRLLWEWVLTVKVIQTVVLQAKERNKPLDNDLAEMSIYLEGLGESIHPTLHPESRIGDLLLFTFDNARKLVQTGQLTSYLQGLSASKSYRAALNALERKIKSSSVMIVLDTIESYKIFEPFMIEGFRGILEAINSLIAKPKLYHIYLKFFVPAEIYEEAFSGVPGKLGDRTVFMRWLSADLISVLAGRFLYMLEKNKSISEREIEILRKAVLKAQSDQDGRHLREEFWYSTGFLPRKIRTTLGQDEDCLAYMFRHTFRRPRDVVIHQMQAIVNHAVLKGDFPYIKAESVIKGVHDEFTLRKILGDALSPFKEIVPGDLVSNARSVFYERSWVMNGRDLKRFSMQLYSLHGFGVEPELFASQLLRSGVIGMPSDLTRDLYRKARFEYMMPSVLPNVRDDLQYCVHPVMGDLFKMKPPSDGKAIYPMPEDDCWLEEAAKI